MLTIWAATGDWKRASKLLASPYSKKTTSGLSAKNLYHAGIR